MPATASSAVRQAETVLFLPRTNRDTVAVSKWSYQLRVNRLFLLHFACPSPDPKPRSVLRVSCSET